MPPATARLGSCDVVQILDGVFEASVDVLVHLGGDAATRRLRDTWHDPVFRIDVYCFALRSPDGIVLVDAGTGPSWGTALGHAPRALRDAGMAPDHVGTVALTHLHGDHALGLFDGGSALFPHAEILVPRAELAHFTDTRARAAASEDALEIFRIADSLRDIYGNRVRPIDPGPLDTLPVEAVPLPGHTDAHTGYLLGQGDDRVLFCGDMLQAVQPVLDPGAGLIYDHDPAQAAQTRRDWLERLARTGWRLAGGHLPGFNRVEALGSDRFRLHRAGSDNV